MSGQNTNILKREDILDFLMEDVLEHTHDDIVAEANELLGDYKTAALEFQTIIREQLRMHAQRRIADRKAELKEDCRPRKLNIGTFEDKLRVLRLVNKANDNSTIDLTLAARSLDKLTEVELDTYLLSLLRLNVIDEEGNIL